MGEPTQSGVDTQAIKPNFFIVGAPKCGTSSMAAYLGQHPEVFVPWYKEPHFFGSDIRAEKYIRDEARYLALFRDAAGFKERGEASTWYLYSKNAAREIKAYAPAARIIAMLRNPVDLAYSMHSHNLYVGNEDIADFESALDAQAERRRGERIPARATHPHTLLYSEIGKFTDQLRRYFDVFGRENVLCILFDDLKRDVAGVYRSTLRFLQVDEDFAADFRIENANKRARSGAVPALLRHPVVQKVGRTVVPLRLAERIADALRSMNAKYEPRPPMTPRIRARLQEEFAPEVERLSALLDRDLRHWSREPADSRAARSA